MVANIIILSAFAFAPHSAFKYLTSADSTWENIQKRHSKQPYIFSQIKNFNNIFTRKFLNGVNSSVNKHFLYQTDQQAYGKREYWATPYEMNKKGVGDCEDFSIMKYYLLKHVGYKDEQLQLVKVALKDQFIWPGAVTHLILQVKVNRQNYYLDNRFNNAYTDQQLTSRYQVLYYYR